MSVYNSTQSMELIHTGLPTACGDTLSGTIRPILGSRCARMPNRVFAITVPPIGHTATNRTYGVHVAYIKLCERYK